MTSPAVSGCRSIRTRGGGEALSALGTKIRLARTVGRVARVTGRGGGTSLPGKVLLRLEPDAIAELAQRLSRGSAIISATNGKTTTATITATILEHAGRRLVHNRAGANMAGGIASTLLAAARPHRRMAGDTGLFEVDEFWLNTVTRQLNPRAVLLSNLFRDQLDRYGELETIADRWAEVVAGLNPTSSLVLNADDPLIADLGRGRGNVTYFGVEDDALALPEMQHASDSKHCRRCGAAYQYDAMYLGHLGHYHCPNCGQERPGPACLRRADHAAGHERGHFQARHAAGAALPSSCVCRVSTTSTTRWRRLRCVCRSGSDSLRSSSPGSRPRPPPLVGPKQSRSPTPLCRSC